MSTLSPPRQAVVYPDSDGLPMADNTRQYEWIVTLKGNLEAVVRDDPAVFVAGNHLIYPVEGDNTVRQAADVYVAFGRPKGHRGSYQVWLEDGVFPQVVVEVLSPGNRPAELARKRRWYEQYGAREYYQYDPDDNWLAVWVRSAAGELVEVNVANGWLSPLLRVRFDPTTDPMTVYRPDGRPFATFDELDQRAEAADQRAAAADQRADAALTEAARLRELLRRAGLDPDSGTPIAPPPG